MNKINYKDKVVAGTIGAILDETDTWRAIDANEVKEVVNAIIDAMASGDDVKNAIKNMAVCYDAEQVLLNMHILQALQNLKLKDAKQNIFADTFSYERALTANSVGANNIFDANCVNNLLAKDCDFNIFGAECNNNSFGDTCKHNIFGYLCVGNVFGKYCSCNVIGHECSYNTLGDYVQYAKLDSNVRFVTLKHNATLYNPLTNIHILSNVYGGGLANRLTITIPDEFLNSKREVIVASTYNKGTPTANDIIIYFADEHLLTVKQPLSEAQKLQARSNISAQVYMGMSRGKANSSVQFTDNIALSEHSLAIGNGTIAGTKGVRWKAINFTTKTITLEKALTASIGAGALLSIINDKHYDKCSEVAETAAIGATTIKVKSLPFTSIAEDTGDDAKTLMVYSNPNAGDVDLGDGAHSEGVNTKATQRGSHAEGRDTYAAGQYSHAEGRETEAFYASHAEGRGSKATGDVSHAEGLGTYAIGDHTHAEGQNTHAVGLNAHAEGLRGWANGQHSHAEGVDTVTSNTAEHAEGKFNKSNKADGSFGSAGNTLHSIGVGTSASDRKNAFEIMQNGDAYLLGVGGYDGKNPAASKAVQQVIGALLDTFKPVQVNDNKSGATDATQLAEIRAYAAKLAAYGVDTTNGYEIPILYNSGSKGFIGYNPNAASSFNGYAVTPEGNFYTLTMNATTGALSKKILATTTVTDALSANKQPKTDAALETTNKTVTGAINEVNDKTAYVAFTDVTKLSTSLGKRLIYKGGNVTLSSPITINSNIYEIDFNGATITIGALARTGITAIKGHSHCIIKNLVVEGVWIVNTDVVSNVLEAFAGVENVSIDVHFSGSKYGRGFFSCQRLINCKAEITSSLFKAVVRGFSYCEYLYMCRIGDGSVGEGFFHCTNMISCDALAREHINAGSTTKFIVAGCKGKELVECSNYVNFRRCINADETGVLPIYGVFSNIDNLSVNDYNLTPFANTIAMKNEGATRALVHPAGGTGVAEVQLSTEAFGNSIARRLDDGRLKAAAATEANDVVNKSQLDAIVLQISALRQTVTELQTEVNALKSK